MCCVPPYEHSARNREIFTKLGVISLSAACQTAKRFTTNKNGQLLFVQTEMNQLTPCVPEVQGTRDFEYCSEAEVAITETHAWES